MRHRRLFVTYLLTIELVGCSLLEGVVPIKKILDNPSQYDGKIVVVSGTVISSYNFLLVKWFTLKDKTGEIAIIAKGSVPAVGEKARVRGTVQQYFKVGDIQMIAIVEETPGKKKE